MERIHTKKALIEAVKNIPIVAEREAWSLTLDRDDGTLFYAPRCVPAGSVLRQITDEYALYLDDKGDPVGVTIEYFCSNFLKHHDAFDEIAGDVFDGEDLSSEPVITIGADAIKENKYAKIFRALLEATLIKEADSHFVVL